jgi:DNA-binding MarR family transcriptional regulator
MFHRPESVDYLLAQICRLHHSRAHALLEEVGLYRGQPHVLRVLWEREGCTHTELAARLHVQPATITRMLQRMERAGFVERRSDPEDQRVSRVYLTEAGRAVQEGVQQIWHTLEEESLAGFGPEERVLLRGVFVRLRDNLMRATGGKHPF